MQRPLFEVLEELGQELGRNERGEMGRPRFEVIRRKDGTIEALTPGSCVVLSPEGRILESQVNHSGVSR